MAADVQGTHSLFVSCRPHGKLCPSIYSLLQCPSIWYNRHPCRLGFSGRATSRRPSRFWACCWFGRQEGGCEARWAITLHDRAQRSILGMQNHLVETWAITKAHRVTTVRLQARAARSPSRSSRSSTSLKDSYHWRRVSRRQHASSTSRTMTTRTRSLSLR